MKIDQKKLLSGDRRTLAKAITLIESLKPADREESQTLLKSILPKTGNSIRIAISGIPGVGKSTFIESFGQFLLSQKKKVAVLAIDPSSPIHGGSILGDKTRMEKLSQSEDAFIRPSPTSGSLGGVANHTRETILLCEAAGFDIILLETVGVGQSEYEAASMVDFFTMLMVPNAGDELQGIKKGILELANIIVINKADGINIKQAEIAAKEYENALHLLSHTDKDWQTKTLTCSALEEKNIDKIWKEIQEYENWSKNNNIFFEKRKTQNLSWFDEIVHEMIEIKLNKDEISKEWELLEEKIREDKTTPYLAAQNIIEKLFT